MTEDPLSLFTFGGLQQRHLPLVLAGARWYSPHAFRWTSRDPIHYEGGDNLYAYVMGNPVGFVDPDGAVRIPIAFRRRFPKSAARIDSLLDRLTPKKRASMRKWGRASDSKIDSSLACGEGPWAHSRQMDGYAGRYNPTDGYTTFNEKLLEDYEAGKISGKFFDALVEHEVVHFLDDKAGPIDPSKESGYEYEKDAYGEIISRH